MAKNDDDPVEKSLEDLVKAHLPYVQEYESIGSLSAFGLAKCIRELHIKIQSISLNMLEPYYGELHRNSIEDFGILSEKIQVKARIALHQISKNGKIPSVRYLYI